MNAIAVHSPCRRGASGLRGAASRPRWASLALVALLAGCAGSPQPAQVPPLASPAASPAATGFTILQINDTYKIEGLRAGAEGGLARVRTLRKELESEGRPVLVLHAGDFLFPSVMSKYLQGVPMVDALNLLDGNAGFDERLFVTPGNHEFDNPELALLSDRIAQSKFTWITSNVAARATERPGRRRLAPARRPLSPTSRIMSSWSWAASASASSA